MMFHEFVKLHQELKAKKSDDLRLGQRFVNEYVRSQGNSHLDGLGLTKLYNETDDSKAAQMIRTYLMAIQVYPEMPLKR